MGRAVLVLIVVVCMSGAVVDSVVLGGPRPIGDFANDLEINQLANFAVSQYKARLVQYSALWLLLLFFSLSE